MNKKQKLLKKKIKRRQKNIRKYIREVESPRLVKSINKYLGNKKITYD